MSKLVAIVLTLVAGSLIALQPPANASLGNLVGDISASFVSLVISTVAVGLVLVLFGDPGRLSGITRMRPEHVLGGLAGALIVTVSLVTVRPLGVAGVVALLVSSQLFASVVIDRLGLIGVHEVAISWERVLGLALVVAGTVLITRG
jgi:transporter family-2 protein